MDPVIRAVFHVIGRYRSRLPRTMQRLRGAESFASLSAHAETLGLRLFLHTLSDIVERRAQPLSLHGHRVFHGTALGAMNVPFREYLSDLDAASPKLELIRCLFSVAPLWKAYLAAPDAETDALFEARGGRELALLPTIVATTLMLDDAYSTVRCRDALQFSARRRGRDGSNVARNTRKSHGCSLNASGKLRAAMGRIPRISV